MFAIGGVGLSKLPPRLVSFSEQGNALTQGHALP
jgi:hypothetical protein